MSVPRIGAKQHFIRTLESQGLLDRQIEFLPTDTEFAERKARGLGLTRPELSILLSYSKIVLFQQLLSNPPFADFAADAGVLFSFSPARDSLNNARFARL